MSSGTFPFEGNSRFPEFNNPLPGYGDTIVVKVRLYNLFNPARQKI